MKKTKKSNALEVMRSQVAQEIATTYPTVEQFCWDKDISKATLSNFLSNKNDFRVSTLVQIANALGKRLVIRVD